MSNSVATLLFVAIVFVLGVCAYLPAQERETDVADYPLQERDVHMTLLMMTKYGIFDYLDFEIGEDNTVTLKGYATLPAVKIDAENEIRQMRGVRDVINEIEVLPPSSVDERIRLAAYNSIFSRGGLSRYLQRDPETIRIVVKNANIMLFGLVGSESEKNIAGIAALDVPGVFGVENNLKVRDAANR